VHTVVSQASAENMLVYQRIFTENPWRQWRHITCGITLRH